MTRVWRQMWESGFSLPFVWLGGRGGEEDLILSDQNFYVCPCSSLRLPRGWGTRQRLFKKCDVVFSFYFYWIRILSHRYEVIDNGGLLCSCSRDKT